MATQGGKGAIDLFGKHGASEFVRESHGRERQQQIGTRLPLSGKAVVPSDQKYKILRFVFRSLDQVNKSG